MGHQNLLIVNSCRTILILVPHEVHTIFTSTLIMVAVVVTGLGEVEACEEMRTSCVVGVSVDVSDTSDLYNARWFL